MAAGNGHERVVEKLLEHGADPTVPEYDGKTAETVAATESIRKLVKASIRDRKVPSEARRRD
jgi:ankyrin repeat protein